MMNDELMPKREGRRKRSLASTFLVGSAFGHPLSSFVIPSSFVIGHSSFPITGHA
jgi:hypothetical protein